MREAIPVLDVGIQNLRRLIGVRKSLLDRWAPTGRRKGKMAENLQGGENGEWIRNVRVIDALIRTDEV